MNKALKDVIQRVEQWPEHAQEEAALTLLAIEQELREPYELSDADRAAIDRSLEDARQGRFASAEQVAAAFGRARRT